MSTSSPVPGIDPAAVAGWLTELGSTPTGPLTFTRIGLGQSNLTYRVDDAAGRSWVLRRPPLGRLLASAHDVTREARIMAALASTAVPVPGILGVTDDPATTEVPLVAIEFVDGTVVDTMDVAEALSEPHRRALALDMPATLAAIHAVDLDRVGLADLASHKPYAQRQLRRWSAQWEQSKLRELPALDALTRRLAADPPEQREVTLVHGDFHLRNLITDPASGAITAVLDWELATLGDPLADMGTLLTFWPEAGEPTIAGFGPSTLPGFPSRAEMTDAYLNATGRDPDALRYWHVLGMWKLAIIAEGVLRRVVNRPENAAAEGVPELAAVDALVNRATEFADAGGLPRA